jgi:hypothetical protein
VTGNHGPADSASNRDSQIKAIIKVAHNLIPYDGAVAAFYEGIVRPLLSKRGFDFAQSVLDAIFAISDKTDEETVKEILANPEVAAFITKAAQEAAFTSSGDKLRALRNAAVNVAVGTDPGEDKRQIFLRAIADLTPTHLRILRILQSPVSFAREINANTSPETPTLEQIMILAFADFGENQDFYVHVFAELGTRGFVSQILNPKAFGAMSNEKKTTAMGDELLHFVSVAAPKQDAGADVA